MVVVVVVAQHRREEGRKTVVGRRSSLAEGRMRERCLQLQAKDNHATEGEHVFLYYQGRLGKRPRRSGS